jgi:protein-S-isoprenylcysteine O-methyltransferase Ste14
MRASDWEFKHRFWIFGLIFWAAFFCYQFDRVNFGSLLANWLQRHTSLSDNAAAHWVFGLGALLSVLAALLRTWANAYLHTETVHDHALRSERLVADGPYRYVRNPLYLGTLVLAAGVGFMASRVGFVVLLVLLSLYSYRLILREESELSATQGESYRNYLHTVPRLFPSPVPKAAAGTGVAQWGQALLGEGFFWMFALASLSFAITLKFRFWWIPLVIALPLYFTALSLLERKKA